MALLKAQVLTREAATRVEQQKRTQPAEKLARSLNIHPRIIYYIRRFVRRDAAAALRRFSGGFLDTIEVCRGLGMRTAACRRLRFLRKTQ